MKSYDLNQNIIESGGQTLVRYRSCLQSVECWWSFKADSEEKLAEKRIYLEV